MTKNINVLVTCLADPAKNPRPGRMIDLCQSLGFTVDTATLPTSKIVNGAAFSFNIPSSSLLNRIGRKLCKAISVVLPFESITNFFNDRLWDIPALRYQMLNRSYDAIIVHDVLLLPFVFSIKKNAKVIFDAREYYPAEMNSSLLWRLIDRPEKLRICRKYMPRCDSIITVSQGIIDRYKNDLGVECTLVRSTPIFYNTLPSKTSDDFIRMVHHGVANRNRTLEEMIDLFSFLDDRFTLDIYLTGNPRYIQKLKNLAKNHNKISFHQPVPFKEIIPTLQKYDIGLCFLDTNEFNTKYSLPNKFFEFIQARLMIAIAPSPEMASLIEKYSIGVVSNEFSAQSMATKLNTLSKYDIQRMKESSHIASNDLCFETESRKIIEIFQKHHLVPEEA